MTSLSCNKDDGHSVSPLNHNDVIKEIVYTNYTSESQLVLLSELIRNSLSEPYSDFTYRYFVNNWPSLTFLAMHNDECVGCIVSKLSPDRHDLLRGYIAMLVVKNKYRGKRIGQKLVQLVIDEMNKLNADIIILETEICNSASLKLYEKLNFVRAERLYKYYL